MTATTKFQNRFLDKRILRKKPYAAWMWTVRAKNRQEAIDTKTSFRDVGTFRWRNRAAAAVGPY
jgi:hypothetical protein